MAGVDLGRRVVLAHDQRRDARVMTNEPVPDSGDDRRQKERATWPAHRPARPGDIGFQRAEDHDEYAQDDQCRDDHVGHDGAGGNVAAVIVWNGGHLTHGIG